MFFFLKFSCLYYDPVAVGSLISGSSAFSKSSLYTWKFLVQVLLKPSLKDFEHYLVSVWNEHNWAVTWIFLALPFFGIGMKIGRFQSHGQCWDIQICWHIECSILTASSFKISNSSAGILATPLAFYIVMLPKTYLTLHSMISASRWVMTPSWFSRSLRPF